MSIQDERDLRDRLGGLLDGIEPDPAPVTTVVRRGSGIRLRRRISVAAGLAVIVAAAIVLPGLLRAGVPAPAAPRHYTVTVKVLGRTAPDGVIGEGTIGTNRWRVVIDRTMGDGCSVGQWVLTCGRAYGAAAGPGRAGVALTSSAASGTQFEVGTVGADVSRVVISLSNGTMLSLRPVTAEGLRWVAVAAPVGTIERAVSFVGRAEYRYAIPYLNGGVAEFATWLRPGQAGLAVASKRVGAGNLEWHRVARGCRRRAVGLLRVLRQRQQLFRHGRAAEVPASRADCRPADLRAAV